MCSCRKYVKHGVKSAVGIVSCKNDSSGGILLPHLPHYGLPSHFSYTKHAHESPSRSTCQIGSVFRVRAPLFLRDIFAVEIPLYHHIINNSLHICYPVDLVYIEYARHPSYRSQWHQMFQSKSIYWRREHLTSIEMNICWADCGWYAALAQPVEMQSKHVQRKRQPNNIAMATRSICRNIALDINLFVIYLQLLDQHATMTWHTSSSGTILMCACLQSICMRPWLQPIHHTDLWSAKRKELAQPNDNHNYKSTKFPSTPFRLVSVGLPSPFPSIISISSSTFSSSSPHLLVLRASPHVLFPSCHVICSVLRRAFMLTYFISDTWRLME